jgi:hypothetical protein
MAALGMLAVAVKFRNVARLLALLAAILPETVTPGDDALTGRMGALG